jgi:L-arabinose isomerase
LAEKKEELRRQTKKEIDKKKKNYDEQFEQQKLHFEKEKIRAEIEARAEQEVCMLTFLLSSYFMQSINGSECIYSARK